MLSEDKRKARLLRLKVARYTMYDDRLYKRGFSTPLLKCVDLEQENYILQGVHEGTYGGQSLAQEALRQGYFWPTMKTDAMDFARKCDKYQRFSSIPRSHPEKLTSMTSPWPFTVWGIDLIGLMPMARLAFKYAVVAVDYFTKWVEANPQLRSTTRRSKNLFGSPSFADLGYRMRSSHTKLHCSTAKTFVHSATVSRLRKAYLQLIIPRLTAKQRPSTKSSNST